MFLFKATTIRRQVPMYIYCFLLCFFLYISFYSFLIKYSWANGSVHYRPNWVKMWSCVCAYRIGMHTILSIGMLYTAIFHVIWMLCFTVPTSAGVLIFSCSYPLPVTLALIFSISLSISVCQSLSHSVLVSTTATITTQI